jgi:hypothetical protein
MEGCPADAVSVCHHGCEIGEGCHLQDQANAALLQRRQAEAAVREVITPVFAMAAMLKDTFDAYLQVGFTENQALKLIAYYMASIGNSASGEEEGE